MHANLHPVLGLDWPQPLVCQKSRLGLPPDDLRYGAVGQTPGDLRPVGPGLDQVPTGDRDLANGSDQVPLQPGRGARPEIERCDRVEGTGLHVEPRHVPGEPLPFEAPRAPGSGQQQLARGTDSLDAKAGAAREGRDARDRIADEEGRAGEAGVGDQDAVPLKREYGGDEADFPWSLPLGGEDFVRLAVGPEHDQFGVPRVVDDRAAVRQEATDADLLEGIVARVGAVAVAGLCGEPEGGGGGWGALVRDDPHARAVRDPGRYVSGWRGVGCAGGG